VQKLLGAVPNASGGGGGKSFLGGGAPPRKSVPVRRYAVLSIRIDTSHPRSCPSSSKYFEHIRNWGDFAQTMIKPYYLEREIFVKRCDQICFGVRQVWAEIFDFEGDAVGPPMISLLLLYYIWATHNVGYRKCYVKSSTALNELIE
jgi:hypothetical protein